MMAPWFGNGDGFPPPPCPLCERVDEVEPRLKRGGCLLRWLCGRCQVVWEG